MSPQMIRPVFDPECRRVFHIDRQGARAHLVALEIWNRATGRELQGRRLTIYRCLRCGGYHVTTRPVAGSDAPRPTERVEGAPTC